MLKNCREEWYAAEQKVAVTLVDVTAAAQALARGHLAGPTAAHFLTEALAAVALLGAETSQDGETVILQTKCSGPLGGLTVECTREGTLRGYTEKKILDAFDGLGRPDPKLVLGDTQVQVTRSVPGRILSQGISRSLDGYLAGSLQRKAVIVTEVAVNDEVEILEARGILIEALPDAPGDSMAYLSAFDGRRQPAGRLATASRTILEKMGLGRAELRRTTPLAFACRCSPERAVTMLQALSDKEKQALPPTLDITCHMCGRIFTVKTRA